MSDPNIEPALTGEQEAFKNWAEWHKVKLLEHWPEMADEEFASKFARNAVPVLARYDIHPASMWDYRIVLMARDLMEFHKLKAEGA